MPWSLTARAGLQFRTLWAPSKAAPLLDSAKANKKRLQSEQAQLATIE